MQGFISKKITQQAASYPSKFLWVKCKRCGSVHHAGAEMPCSVQDFVEAIRSTQCPDCGAGDDAHVLAGKEAYKLLGIKTDDEIIKQTMMEIKSGKIDKNKKDTRISKAGCCSD